MHCQPSLHTLLCVASSHHFVISRGAYIYAGYMYVSSPPAYANIKRQCYNFVLMFVTIGQALSPHTYVGYKILSFQESIFVFILICAILIFISVSINEKFFGDEIMWEIKIKQNWQMIKFRIKLLSHVWKCVINIKLSSGFIDILMILYRFGTPQWRNTTSFKIVWEDIKL